MSSSNTLFLEQLACLIGRPDYPALIAIRIDEEFAGRVTGIVPFLAGAIP
jgi:hypothetical protein